MENKYKTTNFYTATYLITKGIKLVDIDRSHPRRATFVFNSPHKSADLLVKEYDYAPEDSPSLLVDARDLINSIKQLKDKLYQD